MTTTTEPQTATERVWSGPPTSTIVHRDNYGALHILLIWPQGKTINAYVDPSLLSKHGRVFELGEKERQP